MLGSMNRIFPARPYALVGYGYLQYGVVLLVRLFYITACVLVIHVAVLSLFDMGNFWIVLSLPIALILGGLTIVRDVVMSRRSKSVQPPPPDIWRAVWNDVLGASYRSLRTNFRSSVPIITELAILIWLPIFVLVAPRLLDDTSLISVIFLVILAPLVAWFLLMILMPRTHRLSPKREQELPYGRVWYGINIYNFWQVQSPRRFNLHNISPGGRVAQWAFRSLLLVNTMLYIFLIPLGFELLVGRGMTLQLEAASIWPITYWIVLGFALGSVVLSLAYTMWRDIRKTHGPNLSPGGTSDTAGRKALILDEYGPIAGYLIGNKVKRLSIIIPLLGVLVMVVVSVFSYWGGVAVAALYFAPRLFFILRTRPYAPDNTEQAP